MILYIFYNKLNKTNAISLRETLSTKLFSNNLRASCSSCGRRFVTPANDISTDCFRAQVFLHKSIDDIRKIGFYQTITQLFQLGRNSTQCTAELSWWIDLLCKPWIIYSLTPSTNWIISSKVESDVIHSSRSLTMSKQMSHKRSLGLLSSLAGILVADARTVVKAKIVNNIFQGLCWDEKSADEWCFICNSYQWGPCHMFQSSFSLMLCAHLCHLSLYKTCHQGNTF